MCLQGEFHHSSSIYQKRKEKYALPEPRHWQRAAAQGPVGGTVE